MKSLLCISLFFVILSCINHLIGQSGLISEMDQFILEETEKNNFSGSIIIGKRDSIIYSKTHGLADRNWNIALSPDHRFDIASVNKSFIAALILLASEEGKLSMDTGVLTYLTSLDIRNTDLLKDITLHQLLTHTSGIGDYSNIPSELKRNNFLQFKRKNFSNEAYVNFISSIPALSDPGIQFGYSNFGYHLLAIVLEEIYKIPFAQLLTEKISTPMRLENTFSPESNTEIYPNVIEGYTYINNQWYKNNFIDFSLGRRIYSTAADLLKWVIGLQSEDLLSPESRALMFNNHIAHLTQDISYGYGWVVFDGNNNYKIGDLSLDRKYIIHGGSTE